jgi:uncharacterized cupin superfamily protein
MEIHPGVFVSSVRTEEWEADPEVGGEMHVLVEDETAFAGLSRFTDKDEVGPWTAQQRETVLVLEGHAQIDMENGPTVELGVGDMASFPKGSVMTWHLTLPFKEVWFFGRPFSAEPE